jgi:hypothetical protein
MVHLKELENSTVVSPKRMQLLPPCLNTCFSSSGSRLGSNSSPVVVYVLAYVYTCVCVCFIADHLFLDMYNHQGGLALIQFHLSVGLM